MQLFSDEVLMKMGEILETETAISEDDNSEGSSLNDQYFYAWNKLTEWLKEMDRQTK